MTRAGSLRFLGWSVDGSDSVHIRAVLIGWIRGMQQGNVCSAGTARLIGFDLR